MATRPTGFVVEPHGHVVRFYDRDAELVDDVARFLAEGLRAGEPAVVIATPDHLPLLEGALAAAGVDMAALRAEGRYHTLDAAATLASFVVDGELDAERFDAVVGGTLAAVAAAHGGGRVRAFGEMVWLLWQQGQVPTAVELEMLWNDLLARQEVALYCAYRASILGAVGDLGAVAQVCEEHSVVLPPSSYRNGAEPTGPEPRVETSQLFVPSPLAAGAVRRMVTDTLYAWGAGALADDAGIVASELAVLHATSAFRVDLRRAETAVTLVIEDTEPSMPVARPGDDRTLSGRGLALVEALSARWGTDRRRHGKVVWAVFPLAST